MLTRLKSSSLVLVVIGSMTMSICNCFHKRLANNGKRTTFTGYHSLMPSCANFLNLENRYLDRRNLRSMPKISCAASPCLSQLILAQFTLQMCLAARNSQKIHKIPILASKVIEFSGNREPVYDFLLVINTNLGPIHTISEIQRLIG